MGGGKMELDGVERGILCTAPDSQGDAVAFPVGALTQVMLQVACLLDHLGGLGRVLFGEADSAVSRAVSWPLSRPPQQHPVRSRRGP